MNDLFDELMVCRELNKKYQPNRIVPEDDVSFAALSAPLPLPAADEPGKVKDKPACL